MRVIEAQSVAGEILDERELEERLVQLRGKVRCVRRALWLMTVLTGMGIAGVCYSIVFLPNFPQSMGQFLMEFAVKAFSALGLASLICLLSFSALEFLYRKELARQREARRQHILGTVSVRPAPAIASVPPISTVG